MNESARVGSRPWLLSQLQHGIHVEERCSVLKNNTMQPSAVALLENRLIGFRKACSLSLQEYLSNSTDILQYLDIKYKKIRDIKVRRDFLANRERINGKQCQEAMMIFFENEDGPNSCKIYSGILSLIFGLFIQVIPDSQALLFTRLTEDVLKSCSLFGFQ